MSADPAVEAAAEAMQAALTCERECAVDHAEVAVLAARPIIEAEVRERIAAEVEAGAWRAMKFSLHYEDCWQHHAQCATHRAARIARGQS